MARTRTLNIVVAGDDDKATRMWRRQSQEADKFGKQMRLTTSVTSKGFHGMRAAATGFAAGIGGAVLAAKGFVDAASDINESLTKNQALFGKYAKGIERYAQTTATAIGISRREALAAAGTFGGLFDAIDIGEKQSAKMSQRLVTLAADLASFNNASPEEALDALRSGLAGEAEPMRRFNAFLSEARVQAEAASMGIAKTAVDTDKLKAAQLAAEVAQQRYNVAVQRFGAGSAEAKTAQVGLINAQERSKKATQGGTATLTEAQKVQARYSLILKDTAKAQGDFKKTKDGDANQTRILKAQYADLTSQLGDKLLPAKLKVTRALNKFITEMQHGTGTGGKFVDTLKDIWQQVEPVVLWVGRATKNIAEFAAEHPKVTKLAAEVVGVGAAIKGLRTASAAVGFTDLLKAGRVVMRKLVALFAAQGAAAGAAAGASAAGAEGLAGKAGAMGRAGRVVGKSFGKGLIIGAIAGVVAFGPDLIKAVRKSILGAPERLGEKIGHLLGGLLGTNGDGPGRPSSSKGSRGLLGARSSLQPFANIASGYGLSVTSGRRPGSITSSGNVSYHSTGEAIDVGDGRGPDANKLRFFRDLKRRYGSRLAELIYTPGGPGIKNGRPFTYTGQVAEDHYDHVHVAVDSGKAGVGDGLGKFVSTAYGPPWGGIQGTGVTAAGVNLKGSPHIYGVAADPRVLPLGSRVKINPNPFGYGGTFKVFDTGGAIKGKRIDFYDWRGRVSQNSWGRRTVNVSTATATPTSASTSESLQSRVDANQRRLDSLRDQLAGAPKGLAGAVQRDRIQEQIQALLARQRSLRADLKDAPTAAERTEAQERSGSRLVNRIMAPFTRSIREATRGAAQLGSSIEDQGTTYGQAERLFGQTDEDLGTAAGRTRRVKELTALALMKKKTLDDQRKRATFLKRAISKTQAELKKLRAARDRQHGAKRAKMSERIAPVVDRLDDLRAELHSLTGEIVNTQLDIGDLAKEAKEAAGTPDTEVEPGPSAGERTDDLVSLIDARERAGVIDSATAAAQRTAVRQAALGGALGPLSEREQLQIMGDLREATQQAAQDMSELRQAVIDLKASIDQQNAISGSIVGIQLAEAQRVIGDMFSSQLGARVSNRGMMPGSGALARL